MGLEKLVPDPTSLLVIDEADRLKIAGLEQAAAIESIESPGSLTLGGVQGRSSSGRISLADSGRNS